MDGYLGRIKYIGESTTLTFTQINPLSDRQQLHFTHNTIPDIWSEFFLVGTVRGDKKKNPKGSVYIGTQNFIITGDGGTVTIPDSSGSGFFQNHDYNSTWVDLLLIRKNQAHQDIIPNGNYNANFTIKSDKKSETLFITINGYRNAPVSATAWLSLNPENVTINLSDALGNKKVEVTQAEMHLEGNDYEKNYGVHITFRDYLDLESSQFTFRHTMPNINTTIPFSLYRGASPSQTQVIEPKVPIIWDNLSFTQPNTWKLYITNM